MRIKNDELEKFRLRYLQTRKSEYKYGYKNRLYGYRNHRIARNCLTYTANRHVAPLTLMPSL